MSGMALAKSAPWLARAIAMAAMKRRSPSEPFFESSTDLSRWAWLSGGGITAER